jgi:hypothetical protein
MQPMIINPYANAIPQTIPPPVSVAQVPLKVAQPLNLFDTPAAPAINNINGAESNKNKSAGVGLADLDDLFPTNKASNGTSASEPQKTTTE